VQASIGDLHGVSKPVMGTVLGWLARICVVVGFGVVIGLSFGMKKPVLLGLARAFQWLIVYDF
jgi:hypothetical protein